MDFTGYENRISDENRQHLTTLSEVVTHLYKLAHLKKVYVQKCLHWSIEFIADNYDIVMDYDQPIGKDEADITVGWVNQPGRLRLHYKFEQFDDNTLAKYSVALAPKSDLLLLIDVGFVNYSITEFIPLITIQINRCKENKNG